MVSVIFNKFSIQTLKRRVYDYELYITFKASREIPYFKSHDQNNYVDRYLYKYLQINYKTHAHKLKNYLIQKCPALLENMQLYQLKNAGARATVVLHVCILSKKKIVIKRLCSF